MTKVHLAFPEAAARKAAAFLLHAELPLLAILSPLFLFPSFRTLPLLLMAPLLWIGLAFLRREPVPLTPLNGSLALLLVMVLISTYATFDVAFSLGKIAGVLFGVALYFSIVRRVTEIRLVMTAIELFAAVGAALATVGVLGTNWIGKIASLQRVAALIPALIRGVPGQAEGFQPNAVAGALILFVPLQISLALSGRRRLLHTLLAAWTISVVLLMQSRSAWISLLVALALWMLWHSRRSRIAVAVVSAFLFAALAFMLLRLEYSATQLFGPGLREDTASRIELWSRAVYAIQDFPITGMGMNAFRRVMPVMYPAFLAPLDVDVTHAHNHLLQAALDLGLPGLIAYLAIWFIVSALLVEAYRLTTDASKRLVISGMAAGLIAYFIFGTADAIALGAKVGFFFWVALALTVAMHRSVLSSVGDPQQ